MEDIKQLIIELEESLKSSYKVFKEYIFKVCENARKGIFLTQNEYEYFLDHLLDYAIHINVEEDFEMINNSYISIYPDSVEQYIKYYNELFDEE